MIDDVDDTAWFYSSLIRNIIDSHATGKLIKIANQELSIPICNLTKKSMKLRCFPGIMKSVEVAPLYKNTTISRDNYRPVSILTVISKLYETVLNTQMVDHVLCYSMNS